jgi:predicted nucleic acid-binding protein
MIVVDTSVWIDYVNGIAPEQTDILCDALQHTRIITGDLIIAEFLQGFRSTKNFAKGRQLMDSLEYHDLVDKKTALKAAEHYRILRRNGITVRKTIDVLIATYCIAHGYALLHNDRDFDAMEEHLGLFVIRKNRSNEGFMGIRE